MPDKDWGDFTNEVEKRLKKGEVEYGDESFNRSAFDLVSEIQEELADVCGWSFILWRKLQRMKELA